MHRNTLLLIIFLAIFAAVVTGVNLSRQPDTPPAPLPTPTPTPAQKLFVSDGCGVSFTYGLSYQLLDNPSGGALLSDVNNPKKAIAVSCESTLPRPKLSEGQIEMTSIGTVSATIYKDSEGSTRTVVHKLFFRHPVKKLDVFIAGSDGALDEIRPSLTIVD